MNCGHASHCGIRLTRTERDWKDSILGEIVVCEYCRCELCSEKASGVWSESILNRDKKVF